MILAPETNCTYSVSAVCRADSRYGEVLRPGWNEHGFIDCVSQKQDPSSLVRLFRVVVQQHARTVHHTCEGEG